MSQSSAVRRGFVNVRHGQVHFRHAGHGPPVVLLHDSPRSSTMHVPLLGALANEFTAIAIDTPGYGLSTPLPGDPRPEIPDFAAAIAEALGALGIERCPVYGFHTSSKITLQFAIDHPQRVSLAIIDGLSLPPGGPPPSFIERYMKPFAVSDDGSHLAVAWAKGREFFRFFPWFDKSPAARLPLDFPDEQFLHGYVLDLLMAGASYSSAYSAAMRYLALPRVAEVAARTVFMCRANDPLYTYLDALPADLPAHCSIERLSGDPDAWRDRVTALLRSATSGGGSIRLPDPLAKPRSDETLGYITTPRGQFHVRRYGPVGATARPLLLLPEVPGSSAQTRAFAAALATDRCVIAVDLPGIGESDPVGTPDAASFAESLLALLDVLGEPSVDLYAAFTSAPLAAELARQASNRVHALVLDGLPPPGAAERRTLWKRYCPAVAPRWDGAHLFSLWHRLRDQELTWPWYAREATAIRRRRGNLDPDALHAATVDLAKQPAHYADAALAALEVDIKALLRAVTQPVLLVGDAHDPRDAALPGLARLLGAGQRAERGDDPAALAAAIRAFLG